MRWIGGVSLGTALGIGTVLAWADAPKAPAIPAPAKADPKAAEFFETKIRPVLSQQCFACHGDKQQKGKLRLDNAADLFRGGETGAVVTPGHPEKSVLIDSISYSKELKMPPQGKLKPQQIADLTAWVKMGAPWPGYDPSQAAAAPKPGGWQITDEQRKFWAFQPVKDPAVPAVKNKAWVKSPIDAFILAALEKKGLKPAPAADKRTLIRRVTFDLTGLPPTPEEIDAFLADTSPDAFSKVVDRLLATPAYGERWGRHWLDIARYADSNGLDENTAFANAYRYRDYVIRSFNADKPYDQFVREQLAGDLLPASQDDQANADRLTATGFLVLGPKVLAEPDKPKMLMDIVDEQIDTTSKAFMGMTLACARCHDHKFDPLATKDYYALAGIFKSTRAMKSLNTVAQAYERPLGDKESVEKAAAHQKQVEAKQEAAREAAEKLNAEISTRIVNDTDRYLLLGLQAAVTAANDLGTPDLKRPGTVVLEAEKFSRGDVKVTTDGQPQGFGYIESAGRSAAFTEYEITLPTAGDYELSLRYASGEKRPVALSLDGKAIKNDAAAEPTGGFGPGEQQWRFETLVTATAGKHVVRLDQRAGSLPHVDKIVLVPAAGAPVAASATRTRKPSDLAKEAGLDAETLRRSASYLLASQARGDDPVFGPWHQLSALPAATFAQDAAKLVADWKANGKLQNWAPPVAQLFSREAPKSLEEAAGRYKTLFTQVNDAWIRTVQNSKKAATKLGNSDQETVRQALYGAKGAFGLSQIERFYTAEASASLKKLKDEAEALAKATPEQPMVLAVEEASQIGDVKVHIRGNHLTLGDDAPRIFLRVVAGDEEKQKPVPANHSGRLELAQWLTDPAHPLTTRVMVNRIWEHHFGQGLVRTPDNFGKLGDRPSHPELLDWLAKRFVEKGWSMKAMHRMILLSSAYQMSTANDPKAALADPENRLLWHFNRRRLEVEAIRDSIFAVAGTLDRTMGGSLLKTPNFGYVTNDQSGNGAQYDSPRRAIYLPVIRNAVYDVFQVFDFVEPSFPNGARASTTVAPQALFLLNGQLVLDQAEALSKQLLANEALDDTGRLKSVYLRAFGRPAEPDEITKAQTYIQAYASRLAQKEPDAARRRQLAWQSFCQILFASNEFVYVN
jgi:cytochrome c553